MTERVNFPINIFIIHLNLKHDIIIIIYIQKREPLKVYEFAKIDRFMALKTK